MTAVVSIEIGGMSAEYVRAANPYRQPEGNPSMNRDAETVPARHETPDVAELRRLAEAATPGPWEWDDNHARPGLRHGRSFGGVLFRCGALYGPDAADAAFIAAANPAVVLALLDRLAHMTEARDNARAEVERLAAVVEAVREYAAARQANIDHGPLLSARKAAHDALLAALARLDEEPQPTHHRHQEDGPQ